MVWHLLRKVLVAEEMMKKPHHHHHHLSHHHTHVTHVHHHQVGPASPSFTVVRVRTGSSSCKKNQTLWTFSCSLLNFLLFSIQQEAKKFRLYLPSQVADLPSRMLCQRREKLLRRKKLRHMRRVLKQLVWHRKLLSNMLIKIVVHSVRQMEPMEFHPLWSESETSEVNFRAAEKLWHTTCVQI